MTPHPTSAGRADEATRARSLPDFDALWDYDRPAETEARFRELLNAAEESGDVGYRLELLTQVARTQGLQGKFEDARATLALVERRLEASSPAGDRQPVARTRWLLELGRVANSAGGPAGAVPLFERAWELARREGLDGYAADAAHMLGIAAASTDEQLAGNLKALELAEASDDSKAQRWVGALLNNSGWTYHDAGAFEQALDLVSGPSRGATSTGRGSRS